MGKQLAKLLGFEREGGGGDPLTAQAMIGCLPSYDPMFVQFGAHCRNDDPSTEDSEDPDEDNSYKQVVVQFDTQEAYETAEGDMFDTMYDAFEAGLPAGWVVDDALEPVGEASNKLDYVRYNGGMTPEVVQAKKEKEEKHGSGQQKRKRTVPKAD